jgi:hypothetical protein
MPDQGGKSHLGVEVDNGLKEALWTLANIERINGDPDASMSKFTREALVDWFESEENLPDEVVEKLPESVNAGGESA